MTYQRYMSLVSEAANCDSKMKWYSNYGFPSDCPYSGENLQKVLDIIYYVAHEEYRAAITVSDSVQALSNKYQIPYQTIVIGTGKKERKVATWTLQMLAFAVLSDVPMLEDLEDD